MKLFCRQYGAGPPLIILHGLYGSSDNWASIAKKLGEHFTVILPDMRNHGLSPHSMRHDYDSMSEDIYELVNARQLKHFFLAGHSMGGKTAMRFALRWPEKLDGLLIADISPFAAGTKNEKALAEHILIFNTILSVDLSAIRSRKEVEESLLKVMPERNAGLILKNLQRNSDKTFSWKLNAASLLKNIDSIMDPVIPDNFNGSPVSGFPVYFLRGDKSEYLSEEDFIPISRVFPSTEFVTIPSAGHWLHADNPEAVVSAFLKLGAVEKVWSLPPDPPRVES